MDLVDAQVTPVLVGDLDLDDRLPELNPECQYQSARLLVRLHGRPIGEVLLSLQCRALPAADVAAQVWSQLGNRIAKHYADDGLTPPAHLTAAGLTPPERSSCATRWPVAAGPSVTVVIATRDRTESLLRCLASVSRLDYPMFDVVVADSSPRGDATARALDREWPFPLQYLCVARPGLALAHNEALRAVAGEIIAITDDDVEVEASWLSVIAEAFAGTSAVCVTGLILPAELQTRAQVLVEEAGGFARGFTRRIFTHDMPDPSPLFPFTAGRFGSGANMAFRTDWLLAHGGFDPATGAGSPARGGDDLLAFLRVIIEGGTLVYEPAAVVRHWHRADYEGLRRQAFGYGVGTGAYLTATAWKRPSLLWEMLRRTTPALRHLLDPGSARNSSRGSAFPRELIWRETAGVLVGPAAYALSRWRYRGYSAPRSLRPSGL